MAVGSSTTEVLTSVAPKRLWMALAKDSTHFLPMALPDIFASGSIVEGDGGAGSIKQFHFTAANKDFSYAKEKVDELNEKDLSYKYTALEGGLLGTKLKSAKFEMKFSPTAEDECLLAWICEFDTLSDSLPSEAEDQETKAGIVAMVKMVESYILSNPQLYR
eukprot:Gb_09963 [translate_table: standard]